MPEVQSLLLELTLKEDNAAFNFVNAIEDLLWAFEQRATASWIFQLAIRINIYRSNVFRYSTSSSSFIIDTFTVVFCRNKTS